MNFARIEAERLVRIHSSGALEKAEEEYERARTGDREFRAAVVREVRTILSESVS